ncbi:MAG: Nif3-like dinuclear metal center hexameric protein [Phycisphaerae bacterium]|nr:Nif3-like dinuclear metal center hexameric protein [Phycisphaerae bacterium]
MTTPSDIIKVIETWSGRPLNGDEYVTFGSRTAAVRGITVAWTVTPRVIAAAAKAGHNCIVHHESLLYPYPAFTAGHERAYLSWPTNVQRLRLLSKQEMTTIRIHGTADELRIFDAFAAQLGLGQPVADDGAGRYWAKVFASPVATFGELLEHVKRAVGMKALRVTREESGRPVKRIALPWGGVGLFVNVGNVQDMLNLGVDTLICGETDNYGFRFAEEVGVAVIETSHEVSEAEGLKQFAERLNDALDVEVRYVDVPCVWETA